MKKALFAVFFFLIVLNSCSKNEKTIPNNGIINFISGKVSVIENGKKIPAMTGLIVKESMVIETGSKSLADIYFGSSVIRVLGNSSVSMKKLTKEINSNNEIMEFYVEKGQLFSRVSRKLKQGERYRVSTPTVTAGVRGTEFMVDENRGKGKISCIEGVVAVRKAGDTSGTPVEVRAGKEAVLGENNSLSVNDLKEENIERIRKIRDEIKDIQKDIRDKFEKQRDEIRQQVSDQKDKNRQMVQDQKTKDKENVEKIKEETKLKSDAIKADTQAKKDEAKNAVKGFNKPDIKGVKPDIKNFNKKQ